MQPNDIVSHKCDRPYCNGQRHDQQSVYNYPTCCNCGIELNDILELVDNSEMRSKEMCEICCKQYTSDCEEKIHFLTHFYRSNEQYEQKFYCILCENFFTRSAVISSTVQNKYKMIAKKRFTCHRCTSSYFYEKDLAHHKYLKHGIKETMKLGKSYACSICSNTFSNMNKLTQHMDDVHPTVKGALKEHSYCRFCDETFASRTSRLTHETTTHRSVESGMYQCPFCSKEFSHVSKYSAHKLRHMRTKPTFVCDICGKGFYDKSKLNNHGVVHTEERPFQCEICSHKFKAQSAVNRHIRNRHTTERRYKCNQCDKTYRDSSDLRRHRWSHGGYEKKFQCTFCNKKFFERKTLKYHMKTHKITDSDLNMEAKLDK